MGETHCHGVEQKKKPQRAETEKGVFDSAFPAGGKTVRGHVESERPVGVIPRRKGGDGRTPDVAEESFVVKGDGQLGITNKGKCKIQWKRNGKWKRGGKKNSVWGGK